MDDGLAPKAEEFGIRGRVCLNPCCSGRWSRTLVELNKARKTLGLNPCCCGRWSRTGLEKMIKADCGDVLILVVVDNGLVHIMTIALIFQSLKS